MKIDYSIFNQEKAVDRFIYALENEYFVEAHELLEDDWNNYKKIGEKQKALVLKGFINGATAFALYYKKNKPHGYKKVWPVFIKYLVLLDDLDLKDKERFYFARDLMFKINKQIESSLD